MTPLFKFSLLGLGAASAGGGVICISKREAIREYFRGPSNQTPAGSGEGSRASGVQESSRDTSTESSTTDTQGTDLNNRGQDSNQGETRSPVPGEDQVDGSKSPVATEDQKVNGASETAESPQDPAKLPEAPQVAEDNAVIPSQPQPQQVQDLQQPDAPRDQAQDRGNLPTDQNQIQQLPPSSPGARDQNPGKPQGQDGESVQGSKVVGGDAVDGPQKPNGEVDPKVNPQGQDSNPAGGSQRAGEGVNHVPVPGPDGAPGPVHDGGADPNTIHRGGDHAPGGVDPALGSKPNGVPAPAPREGDQTDPNATPQGGVPSPDGTRQPRVEGPAEKVPTQDETLTGQQRAPGAGGGGGSLPKGEGSQIEQGSGDPGSGVSEPGAGGLPGSPGHTPTPSHPAPVADTTDYQCLFGEGSYDSQPNKKAIKDFLDSMGIKGKHGFQIHDDNYEKGFKCAKDMEDEKLAGLKDYMEGEKTNFNPSPDNRHDNGPTVWAFKKNGDSWTMYERDSESDEEETIIAKTAES